MARPAMFIVVLAAALLGCSSPDPGLGTDSGRDAAQADDGTTNGQDAGRDVGGDNGGSDSSPSDDASGVGDVGDVGDTTDANVAAVQMLPCRISTDNENDGSFDLEIRQSFDSGGRLIRRETDNDADGTADSVITYEYDANSVTELHDNDVDGTPEYTARRVFDDQERVVREEYDNGADGTIDEVNTTEYTATTKTYLSGVQMDGSYGASATTTYNAAGQPIREEWADSDGVLTIVTTWTYDAAGLLLQRTEDTGNDGVDTTSTYSYDAQDRLVLVEGTGPLGMPRFSEVHIWSDEGLTERIEGDLDADGTVDRVFQTTKDIDGNIVEQWVDGNNDGIRNWLRTWEFDEYGREVRWTQDWMGDGVINTVRVSEYTCL